MGRKIRRRKLKKVYTFITCLMIFTTLFFLGIFFYNDISRGSRKLDNNTSIPLPTTTPLPEKKEMSFSLVMVGDALIHQAVYADAKQTNGTYQFDSMLEGVSKLFSSYDVAYYNQETILGGEELGLSTYPSFNSPYSVGDAFIKAGFDLVSLSTNHTLDRGEKAILNSRKYWNKQSNVFATGSYSSFEERNTPVIKEVNGITYTMLSYTDTTNGLKVPSGKEYLVNVYEPKQVKKDIEAVIGKADVVMVSMHWGTEYNLGISARQKEIATYLSSLGVNIIIGTHPHVVEPIEFIDQTMVVYSLGNVISAQRGVEKLTGGIASVTVKKTVEDGNTLISLENPGARLIYTYSKGTSETGRYDFKLYLYEQLTEQLLPNYMTYYDKYIKVLKGSSGKVLNLDDITKTR